MLKKALLATSTLAIILVLFLIYHLGTGGAEEPGQEPILERIVQEDLPLPDAGKSLTVKEPPKIKNIPITQGGKKAWVTWYDKKTRKARLQFRATTWEPVAETEFHMLDMEVRMLMPGGQIAEVRADEGQVLMTHGDLSEATARRGWLKGNVRVLIDRTTPEWRERHPDLRDMAQHPEQTVRIWMDELRFDLELSRIETASAFRLQGAEVDLEGKGLHLRWNDEQDRIEYLEITKGKQIKLRGYKADIDFAPFGGQVRIAETGTDEVVTVSPKATETTTEPAASSSTSDRAQGLARSKQPEEEEDPDLLKLDFGQEEEPGQPVTYRASFTNNVVAERRRGLELIGRMQADTLALVFDGGQLEQATSSGQPEDEQEDQDVAERPAPEKDAHEAQLVLTWDGPLVVEPEESAQTAGEPRRLHVEAAGSPLKLQDKQGSATCNKLVYHDEAGRLWLHGTRDTPMEITAGPNRFMRAETLFYDRSMNTARLTGVGEMKAESLSLSPRERLKPPRPQDAHRSETSIRWSRWVELEIDQAEFQTVDPETGDIVTTRNPWVKRAVLDGDVALLQEDQLARADHMEVDFTVPKKPGRRVGHVRAFKGQGDVRLVRSDDDIRCEHMTIQMTTTPDGRNVPTSAQATGNVTATQRDRVIQASESMRVTMSEVPDPQTEVTVERAQAIASSRGIDPDKVDWNAWARKQAERTRTAIVALEARGDVRVDDPVRRLRVRADFLDCTFPDGRQIDRATVSSREPRTSEVHIEDFGITGSLIDLDASLTWARVPGPGRIEFYTDQDLDGSPLHEPIPVAISWDGQMEMRGESNQLHFEQRVRSSSTDSEKQHYHLDCDRLTIDFVDLPAPVRIPERRRQSSPYWILQPLLDRLVERENEKDPPLAGGSGIREFGKKPIFLLADGNAVALSSRYAPAGDILQSRLRIAGPRIAVDLRRRTTNVEGAGNLLIEDYRFPSRSDRPGRPSRRRGDPLLGDWAGSGPSQTLIIWENSMSYLTRRNVAVFDRDIRLTHRAGTEMVLGKRLATARNLDVDRLQKIGGRHATLDCDNLLVEFARDESTSGDEGVLTGPRSASLRVIEATGNVTLKDGTKTLIGHQLTYLRDTGLVSIRAQRDGEAHIYDEDSRSSRMRAHWKGRVLRWNLNNNRIEASGATVLLSGR